MARKLILKQGVDFFTGRDLYEMTAHLLGLRMAQNDSLVLSRPLKNYRLKPKLLAFLANCGIKQQQRPDGIFTLIDGNLQNEVPGWAPSNYWNFREVKDISNLKLGLTIRLQMDQQKSGILVLPATSAGLVSPCDHLPNWRMFQAIARYDEHVPRLVLKLANSEKGHFLVIWKELKLEGLRTLDDLFRDFAGNNEAISQLASHHLVFEPKPHHSCSAEMQYIVKEVQEKILAQWRQQLKLYKEQLSV